MSDIRRTVDLIRSCLRSTDMTLGPELRDAAELYADACRKINERLGRCEQMLKQGLRAEAIRQAEIDPDLLGAVSDLDFEGRDTWEERLMMSDFPTPPDLNRKAVEALNKAYAEEAPLAELLKHHRLLALARAPLRERVETVRLLARAEPTNPAWGEDVALFESARMDEMRGELRQIRQASDWARMQLVNADAATGWQTFLPLDFVNDVEREFKRQGRIDAEKKLQKYRQTLQRAVDAFDLPRASQLKVMIEDLFRERDIPAGDPLAQPLEPLLDWVVEQERLAKETRKFEKACRDLDDAVAQKADPQVLGELHQAARGFNRPLPREVEQRYQDRLRGDKMARLLKAGLFVAALLLMGGCFVAIIVGVLVMGR